MDGWMDGRMVGLADGLGMASSLFQLTQTSLFYTYTIFMFPLPSVLRRSLMIPPKLQDDLFMLYIYTLIGEGDDVGEECRRCEGDGMGDMQG